MTNFRKIRTVVATICLLSLAVSSQIVESPARISINSGLIKSIFHKKDHEILKIFEDLELDHLELKGGDKIQDLVLSLETRGGKDSDFDMHVSLDETKFLGVETSELKFTGKGNIVHGEGESAVSEAFTIEGPITQFRVSLEVKSNETDGTKYTDFKELVFAIDQAATTVASDSKTISAHADELKAFVQSELSDIISNLQNDIGEENYLPLLKKLPIMNIAPLISMFYASKGTERVRFTEEFVELGYTPKDIGAKLNITNPVDESLLKPIHSVFNFTPNNEPAFSVIIDENFVNYFILPLIQSDFKISLREIMETSPKMALFSQLLTAKTISSVMPNFKEDFKDATKIDIIGTLSHNSVIEGLENAVPTGLSIDHKGNFVAQVNAVVKIVAEVNDGEWVDARSMYATVALKGKAFIMNPELENRTLVIVQKSLDLSNLKIYKDDDEQFLEQMLMMSIIGAQLESLKQKFKPKPIPLKKFERPKEFACFGFNITDIDVKFNDGYIQVDANFVEVAEPSSFVCEALATSLQQSPEKILEMIKGTIAPTVRENLKHAFEEEKVVKEDKQVGEDRRARKERPGRRDRGPKEPRVVPKIPDIQIPEELLRDDL